jgi:hypothetical protein
MATIAEISYHSSLPLHRSRSLPFGCCKHMTFADHFAGLLNVVPHIPQRDASYRADTEVVHDSFAVGCFPLAHGFKPGIQFLRC